MGEASYLQTVLSELRSNRRKRPPGVSHPAAGDRSANVLTISLTQLTGEALLARAACS